MFSGERRATKHGRIIHSGTLRGQTISTEATEILMSACPHGSRGPMAPEDVTTLLGTVQRRGHET